jgi:hypothetical protein
MEARMPNSLNKLLEPDSEDATEGADEFDDNETDPTAIAYGELESAFQYFNGRPHASREALGGDEGAQRQEPFRD